MGFHTGQVFRRVNGVELDKALFYRAHAGTYANFRHTPSKETNRGLFSGHREDDCIFDLTLASLTAHAPVIG